jgi:hypothetical protein
VDEAEAGVCTRQCASSGGLRQLGLRHTCKMLGGGGRRYQKQILRRSATIHGFNHALYKVLTQRIKPQRSTSAMRFRIIKIFIFLVSI